MELLRIGLVLLAAGPLVAQAPPGFKTYENKLAPLTFHYPTAYKEVPLPPTEQLLVAKFVMKKPVRELKKLDKHLFKSATPMLHVFRFEDGAAPVTGGNDGQEQDTQGPSTVREAMEARSRVRSWEEFEQRLPRWSLRATADDPDTFVMQLKRGGARTRIVGRLARKRVGGTIVGVYGYSFEPHEKRLEKIVDQVIKSMAASKGGSGSLDEARIDRLYARGKYGAVQWRKKVRAKLAKGWKAVDTENFLIVHHSKNRGLIQRVERDIEAMRKFYMQLFPPTGEIDRVSVVRICETLEEYHQYGGRPGTGGFWHPGNEELVLFDYSYTQRKMSPEQKKAMRGKRLTSADSMLVLYHEAFHQYIHYAIGEFSPHYWFNEGYGDYFSGAIVSRNTGKVRRVDPSPWRIHVAKDMCEFGDGYLPLEKILRAERAQFYNPARAGHYYAGAWAFVYFLKHSKQALAHPQWSQILATYFEAVKSSYREEVASFGEEPDLGEKLLAGAKARRRAIEETLDGIDLDELEKTWRQWVVDMRDPWPGKRKKRGRGKK